ncbi:MAG: hypothetical protein AB7S50_02750 [Bacteroidales bacterium]
MKPIIALILITIIALSCNQQPSGLTEKSIIGSWECISGCSTEFYTFTKSKNGYSYVSYKNEKIFKAGDYQLTDSVLALTSADGTSKNYIVELINDSLILDKGNYILKKQIEKTDFSNHTEELIVGMEDFLAVFPDFDFADQKPVDFIYQAKVVEDQYEPISIEGIGVVTTVPLGGDFITADDVMKSIANVIREQGFTPDPQNESENCRAFINENMVVMVRTSENEPNKLTMEITFGFID